uniref:Uncharacterized protein n=1 Tax=Anguilla anguilla TaxID=7936 RepID=A0A0E9TIP0_ANGAN
MNGVLCCILKYAGYCKMLGITVYLILQN